MLQNLKIVTLSLFLTLLGYAALGQVKGESGLKWYSWNGSIGFMFPGDPFKAKVMQNLLHNYRFSGIPGFTFALAKPVTIRMNLGLELQDIIVDGKLKENVSTQIPVYPALTTPYYNTRIRTYNLYAQYYLFPNTNLNHFVMVKAGYSRINQGLEGRWDPTESEPGKDTWDWVFTAAYGVTWHYDPNFSVNLYAEYSPTPDRYLGEIYDFLQNPDRSKLPMGRIVLSVTGHTDIRVFFPFSSARKYTTRYKPDKYMPFYRVRKRHKN